MYDVPLLSREAATAVASATAPGGGGVDFRASLETGVNPPTLLSVDLRVGVGGVGEVALAFEEGIGELERSSGEGIEGIP
jgi:hypothetical protein